MKTSSMTTSSGKTAGQQTGRQQAPPNIEAQVGRSKRAFAIVLALGLSSAGLYLLLFLFSDTLVALSAETRKGKWFYALVPLLIALVFSFVHGAFTGRFWDFLGLKAKK